MRTNAELYDLHKELYIITVIKRFRIRWAGHVQRMTEDRAVKIMLIGGPGGRKSRVRPRSRWVDDVDEDLRRLGVRRWRRVAQDRKEWKHVVVAVRALHKL